MKKSVVVSLLSLVSCLLSLWFLFSNLAVPFYYWVIPWRLSYFSGIDQLIVNQRNGAYGLSSKSKLQWEHSDSSLDSMEIVLPIEEVSRFIWTILRLYFLLDTHREMSISQLYYNLNVGRENTNQWLSVRRWFRIWMICHHGGVVVDGVFWGCRWAGMRRVPTLHQTPIQPLCDLVDGMSDLDTDFFYESYIEHQPRPQSEHQSITSPAKNPITSWAATWTIFKTPIQSPSSSSDTIRPRSANGKQLVIAEKIPWFGCC